MSFDVCRVVKLIGVWLIVVLLLVCALLFFGSCICCLDSFKFVDTPPTASTATARWDPRARATGALPQQNPKHRIETARNAVGQLRPIRRHHAQIDKAQRRGLRGRLTL